MSSEYHSHVKISTRYWKEREGYEHTEPEGLDISILKMFWRRGCVYTHVTDKGSEFQEYWQIFLRSHSNELSFFFNIYQFDYKTHIILFVKIISTFLFTYFIINNYLLGAFYVSDSAWCWDYDGKLAPTESTRWKTPYPVENFSFFTDGTIS